MIRSHRLVLALALFLTAAPALFSQSTYATITGVITDSTGAVLPNVEVEGVESGSGYRYTSQSNDSGTYTLPQLREGTYRVRVSHPGLADWIVEGVTLKARDVRRLDVILTVAAAGTENQSSSPAGPVWTLGCPISGTESRAAFPGPPPDNPRAP